MNRNTLPTVLWLVMIAVLIAAAVVILGLASPVAVLAQGDEPPLAGGDLQAASLASEVEPFAMTFSIYRDTWVDEANPHTNYGADLELTLSTQSGAAAFALLNFDLSTLPGDAEVISATLSAYSTDTTSDPYPILPFAITTAWGETSVTWDTRPGTSHLGDPPVRHEPEGWTVFEVTDIVRAWRDGSQPNYGIALRPDPPATGSRTFEARKSARPPELTIYYTRRAELTAVADTWVEYAQPDTPHGSSNNLRVASAINASQEAHALLGFDFASLPTEISVISATLSLFSIQNRAASDLDAALVGVLYADVIAESWDEMTTTWNSAPASAYLEDPPTSWVNFWTRWDVTNIAQSWADGVFDPNGILLRVAPESPFGVNFQSRDLANPPTLVISYGAAPPDCNPITSLDVNGATTGVTGVEYTFDAVYSPPDADPPDNIRWSADDYTEHFYGPSVTLSWDSPGEKTIWVAASHCGGTTSTSHTITISEPPASCDYPIQAVTLGGPLVVATGTDHEFTAAATPINTTLPLTFTWEATGMPPEVLVVDDRVTHKTYNWPTAGTKTILVTAESCGSSVSVHQSVQVEEPASLPDLRVSTAWIQLDEGRIYYVLHNDGGTAAPPGFYVGLQVGVSTPAVAMHTEPIGPDGTGLGYLDYAWTCAGLTADVGIVADWSDIIQEADESNNVWSDTWTCDQQPPSILTGPTVLDISETKARVTWTTDEDCLGWVAYDTSPYDPNPNEAQSSSSYISSHSVPIDGMEAGTTYYVRAICEDPGGLRGNSDAVSFETAPPGSDPPKIRSLSVQPYPHSFYEFWEAIVELEDASYMDRVSCELDGTPLGIDYSADTSGAYPTYSLYVSPHDLGLTREQFFGQPHLLDCTAYRQDPTAFTNQQAAVWFTGDSDPPLRLWIEEPPPNSKIYTPGQVIPLGTLVDVTVDAAAHEWACTSSGFSEDLPPGVGAVNCDDVAPVAVDEVQVWFDGSLKDSVNPGPSQFVHTLTADIGGKPLGDHQLRVVAIKGSAIIEEERTLIAEQGEPGLQVSRSIRREGNTLEVTLDLRNTGTVDARIARLVDPIHGLQPILGFRDQGGAQYQVKVSDTFMSYTNTAARDVDVELNFSLEQPGGYDRLVLAPGESVSVKYVLLPVLHDTDPILHIGKNWNTVALMWKYTAVWIYGTNGFQPQTFDLSETLVNDPTYGMLPLEDAVANAIQQADFVVVTAPDRVYALLSPSWPSVPCADTEQLFSNMAELASLENGVLGFIRTVGVQPLDDLLEPGNGSWSDRLAPSFEEVDEGYVLIVGETEIVPAYYAGEDQFVTYPGIPDYVHDSDLRYAHTAGETARPELVVGRVIGNDLTVLNTYLDNILRALRGEEGYGFNRSRAYVSNGNGDGEDWFKEDVDTVHGQLQSRYDESARENFIGDSGEEQKAAHLLHMPDRDLILYRGHGNVDQWDDGFYAGDVLDGVYDLGGTNPAMLAAACKTGDYEGDNDLNLAEVLLAQGAGAYVGSTELSERWANSDAFLSFVPRWQAEESMGQALNQTKRHAWDMDDVFDNRKLWAFEYNLYGDPKYGRMQAQPDPQADLPNEETLSVVAAPEGLSLKVSLPPLEVSRVDGYHSVQIPGGAMLAELDTYPVPVWRLSMDFPAGRQVQDVALIARGGQEVTGTLSLPVVVPAIDCACSVDDLATAAGRPPEGWFPHTDQVLDWSVEKQPNGSSTLEILLYPFYYNASTGDGVYYRTYGLAVETYDTTARIESVKAPSTSIEPGDWVDLDLVVSRTGRAPADLILQASVRTFGTNKVLGGLPLKTLHQVQGTALASLPWNTRGYAAGDYQVVVELLDTRGNWLDTAVVEVTLGSLGVRISGPSANQQTFAPGDQIKLALGVQNTSTVPIDGTAVFLVQRSEDLSTTQMITVPVHGLAPEDSIKAVATWDTTGAQYDRYRVVGYFKYFSQTTEPRYLILYRPRVFLPLVLRGH